MRGRVQKRKRALKCPGAQNKAYHAELSTNGTNPQSLQYSEYINGLCHMQLEDLSGDDFGNTPKGAFKITSNDAVAPQTWGLSALSELGGASDTTTTTSSTPTQTSSTFVASQFSSFPSSYTSSPLSPSPTLSPPIFATMTVTTAAQLPSASLPSKSLGTAAQAGIGIGGTFSGLALIIAVLWFYYKRFRRARTEDQDISSFEPSQADNFQTTIEVGEGAYHEISGVSRPNELQGIPRAELAWTPRVELSSVSER